MPYKCAYLPPLRQVDIFDGEVFLADRTVFLIPTCSSTTASLVWHDACNMAQHGLLKAASLALLVATGL